MGKLVHPSDGYSGVAQLSWKELGGVVAEMTNIMQFVHVGPHTVAWRRRVGTLIDVAVTVRNPADIDEPLIGAYEAGNRLLAGQSIPLRLPAGKRNPARWLRKMFSLS